MSTRDEKICAELVKALKAMCVRNVEIENIHAGECIVRGHMLFTSGMKTIIDEEVQ